MRCGYGCCVNERLQTCTSIIIFRILPNHFGYTISHLRRGRPKTISTNFKTNSGMNPAFEKHDVNEAITPSHAKKIEAIIITGRDRPPGDKTNRQVRFRPAHHTTFIDSEETSETLKELKTLVWYQSADITRFLRSNEILIRKYRSIVRQSQRKQRTELIATGIEDSFLKEMEVEMRGLEDNFSTISQMRHRQRLENSRRGVLIEQERQRDLWSKSAKEYQAFVLDVEMMRKVCSSNSTSSELIAHSLGRSDAAFTRQLRNMSPNQCDIYRQNNCNIETSKLETTSARHNAKPRILTDGASNEGMERTKATASSILRQLQLRHIQALFTANTKRVSI